MLEFIGTGGRRGRGGRGSEEVTWSGLFRSVLVYIEKETDSISKLEDKGTTSATAHSNRLTRKKVFFSHTYVCAHACINDPEYWNCYTCSIV